MNRLSSPISTQTHIGTENSEPTSLRSPVLRLFVWFTVLFWYTSDVWRDKRPLLIRTAAHLSIVALAIATVSLVGMSIPKPRASVSAGGLADTDEPPLFAGSAINEEPQTAPPSASDDATSYSNTDTISRLPNPHTTFPTRPRAEVITYIAQPGDTLFSIAEQFNLTATTIIWSNWEAFQDIPWLVRGGTAFYILPTDGAYHTVSAGETAESIATTYDVEPAALLNQWNDLYRGNQPKVGQRLVIPGGRGKEIDWHPLVMYPTSGPDKYSVGACDTTMVIGPSGHGWFTYPTGQTEVSGWVFHDWRHPSIHIGIDYDCDQGDPTYAADNGVVTMAGLNGTYGYMVEINHGDGFITRYGHLSTIDVKCGHPVFQGSSIGTCGSTGWSTGPHLHFEIRHNDVPLDPEIYLPPLDSE